MAQFGISVALLTPFGPDGAIDTGMMANHATQVIAAGAHGVTLFGTTGEGASVGLAERKTAIAAVMAALIGASIDPAKAFVGLCATSVEDTLAQLDQALEFGIDTFLLLPPFYFPGPDDQGLRAWHEELFERADARAKFILYHIPQITGVPLSFNLVTGLRAEFPGRVVAIKDSSGSWENCERLLDSKSLPVLVGDERLLHRAIPKGAAGSICGMANLYPARLRALYDTATEDADLSREVDLVVSGPVIPALKALLARDTSNPAWERLRPPLTPLPHPAREALLAHGRKEAASA